MALQPQNLTNLICGPFKFINPTDKRDSSKRVIWECECVCGAIEHGSKADIIKFAGHGLDCPGHPLKGKEKPLDGFTLDPEFKSTIGHAEMSRDWELKRNPDQAMNDISAESESVSETSEDVVEQPSTEAVSGTPAETEGPSGGTNNSEHQPKDNAVLQKRLGLVGYRTTTYSLAEPLTILGQNAVNVVFAENSSGDRILLHISLLAADGKKSIVSSKKRVPDTEWSLLSQTLAGMNVTWRERELRRASK